MKTIAKLGFQLAVLAVAGYGLISMAHADEAPAACNNSDRKTISVTCYERGSLLFDLAKEQGESLSQTKRIGKNGLLEAFASPTDGTWTIVYSDNDKRSCIIAPGDGLPVTQAEDDDACVPPRREAAI